MPVRHDANLFPRFLPLILIILLRVLFVIPNILLPLSVCVCLPFLFVLSNSSFMSQCWDASNAQLKGGWECFGMLPGGMHSLPMVGVPPASPDQEEQGCYLSSVSCLGV